MVDVRKLNDDDYMDIYCVIRDFYDEGHWSDEGEFSPENTMNYICNGLSQADAFGAYVDGELVGVLTLEVCYEFDTRPRAYVTDLFVLRGARGLGIGRLLVKACIAEAVSQDVLGIYAANTGTFSRRANALHDNLFKKYGFEEVSANLRLVL